MMENKDLKKLLDQYLGEAISPSDLDYLFDTLQQDGHTEQWQESIEELLRNKELHGQSDPSRMAQLLQSILKAKDDQNGKAVIMPYRSSFRRWWQVAAAIFLLCASSGIFWEWRHHRQTPAMDHEASVRFKNDVFPGRNVATLTLANGSKIILDSVASGALPRQGNVSLLKSDSGRLAYKILSEKPTALLYNTVSTPRGGQYHLILGDGTKVWLDAGSSLRFPVLFEGEERTVELSGEAYFEVARNEQRPFMVKVNGVSVQVLGTHFNINAYSDEGAIRTTLLEGSVRVVQENQSVLLQPGQQAQAIQHKEIRMVKNPDLEEVMAWKNGVFELSSADIHSVMRQVARWYDVEVKYEGGEIGQTFYGTIPRDVSAINLFKVLEGTGGVHFKIDGKTVTVSP